LISAICAYGQQGLSPYATLSEPPTLLQPGGNSSNGDTWFHAWGSLPNANGTQQSPIVYVDYVTSNDTGAWDGTCSSNIAFSYLDIDTSTSPVSLTSPTVQNCLTDFTDNTTGWDDGYVWHSRGITSINGNLYMAVMRQYDSPNWYEYGVSIMKSINGGRSWCYDNGSDCSSTSNNGKPPAANEGEFCANSTACSITSNPADNCSNLNTTYYDNCSRIANFFFVQYERDGATDKTVDEQNDYIYAIANPGYGIPVGGNYLLRVSRSANLQVGINWQYYTGSVGGNVTSSSNWTGFGTSGSNKPSGCSGSADPTCGATNIFSPYSGADFGAVYVDSSIGYVTTTGFGPTVIATSTSLTGNSSDTGYWVPQIYWPPSLIPNGWSGGANPFIDDFQTPVLATLSTSGTCDSSDPCLTLSSSGDYTNGSPAYAIHTQTLTLHDAGNGANNWSCSAATTPPSSNEEMMYLFDGDTWWNGSTQGDQGPNATLYNYVTAGALSLPTDLEFVTNGLGFPDISRSDVFDTTYSDRQTDFTLLIAFNRSEDYSGNTANAWERIADKSHSGYGGDQGFAIQRGGSNGLAANEWCVYLADAIGGCNPHTGSTYSTGDFPDGLTNLMGIRQCTNNSGCDSSSGTTLTVWNSNSSPSSPLFAANGSALSTPSNSTTLDIGNGEPGGTPFLGTILGFIYYNAALSDSEAAQATNALEDYLYCGARNISFHGAPTGNH
jgi:hypothetical protein